MKKVIIAALVALTVGGYALAGGNTPGRGTAKVRGQGQDVDLFPFFRTRRNVNAYVVTGQNGADVELWASDACDGGDKFMNLGIGLPGPTIEFDVTDGSAEGCGCTHAGGYDAHVNIPNSSLAIVIQRYLTGTDEFPVTSELRISSQAVLNVQQIKGFDECAVSADP